MGLRFRTPLGSLREQRRKAEGLLPTQGLKTTQLRFRNTDLSPESISVVESGKRESLIERLRTVLASEPNIESSLTEYQVIQDELSRISHHQQVNRGDSAKALGDLDLPRTMFFDSAAPFRYIVIDGGKNSQDFFEPISRLENAPNNLDAYVSAVREFDEPAPRSMPLTLLISADAEKSVVEAKPKADPSHDAAQLTQNNVAYSAQPKERSILPKSLVLSLLDDK
ncbi:MAG: hypothetical protein EOP07_01790 [Proteobacteria bacterium]|nr:MAG: hypothetical protein EOP07_01790 [Pseudomonadota bacterium]